MTDKKVHEATLDLVNSLKETNQAVVDSVTTAHQGNMAFAQNCFENGIELLKSHAEETRTLMREVVEQTQKQQVAFQAVVDSAVAAQERNIKYARSIFENGTAVLKNQMHDAHTLTQTIAEQSKKQQEAFQTLLHEAVDAYSNVLYAPFSYYHQTVETAQSIAKQGVETAQKITRQGIDAAQKAAHNGQKTAQTATK